MVAARLFGAEVVDAAERGAGDSQLRLGHGTGDPEVHHPHAAVGRQEDVRGLDVAVDDAPRVGGGKRLRHLLGDLGGHQRRDGAPLVDQVRQVLAIHEFHHDERAGLIRSVVEDADDVRMAE